MLGIVLQVIVVSLAVASISMTMTRAVISKPLREFIKSRSVWFGELFSCPYCFSHWMAFFAVLIVRPRITDTWPPFDIFISMMAIVALAALWCGLIFKAIVAAAPPPGN